MRTASILLSGLLLLQSMFLGLPDLAQLGELMEHAQYHQQQYGDSFLTFLEKHYGDQKSEHQQEHDGHEQLPFQHSPQQFLSHTHYYLSQRMDWNGFPLAQKSESPIFHYLLGSPGVFERGVFQPPRHC